MESVVRKRTTYYKREEKMLTEKQKEAIRIANGKLKEAFPDDNFQICFNLSRTHSNANYNFKFSEIDSRPYPIE